ncbi:CRAL-TRIO domain-containing protein [Xylariaceae sp. FL1019]|nr:CRAL-TRIO domain-containing protein [Xylariaceae sp. FL1019]
MGEPETTPTAPAAPAPAVVPAIEPTQTTSAPIADEKPKEVSTTADDRTEDTKRETDTEKKDGAEPASATKEVKIASLPEEPVSSIQELWACAKAHEHNEIWGVTLADPATHIPSQIVLQKYLNANDGDLVKSREQLTKTLDWRKKMQPLDLVKQKYSKEKFGTLGYVTTHSSDGNDKSDPQGREIFTWNIYGNVKSIDTTFGDLDEFIRWRVALMEQAVHELNLASATKPITSDPDADPYKMFQVHDYKGVSFLRQAPAVKSASTETIRVFATAYPELLKEKFFVNVPALMGFMYGFMKLFVAARTIKKFHPMSNGGNLAKEDFGGSKVPIGAQLPAEYGGKGQDLKTQGTEPLTE